jgi:hypothetical protein
MQNPGCYPHCGGLNGYFTTIVYRASRVYSWDGDAQDTEDYEIKSETNPRCSDCGKSVRSAVDKRVK